MSGCGEGVMLTSAVGETGQVQTCLWSATCGPYSHQIHWEGDVIPCEPDLWPLTSSRRPMVNLFLKKPSTRVPLAFLALTMPFPAIFDSLILNYNLFSYYHAFGTSTAHFLYPSFTQSSEILIQRCWSLNHILWLHYRKYLWFRRNLWFLAIPKCKNLRYFGHRTSHNVLDFDLRINMRFCCDWSISNG